MSIANVKVFYAAALLAGSQTARGIPLRPLVSGQGVPQVAKVWREEQASELTADLLFAARMTKEQEGKRYWFLPGKRMGRGYFALYAANVQSALNHRLTPAEETFSDAYIVSSHRRSGHVSLGPGENGYTIARENALNVCRSSAKGTEMDPLLAGLYQLAAPPADTQMKNALKDLARNTVTNLRVAEVNVFRGRSKGVYVVEFVVGGDSPVEVAQYRMQVRVDTTSNQAKLEEVLKKKVTFVQSDGGPTELHAHAILA